MTSTRSSKYVFIVLRQLRGALMVIFQRHYSPSLVCSPSLAAGSAIGNIPEAWKVQKFWKEFYRVLNPCFSSWSELCGTKWAVRTKCTIKIWRRKKKLHITLSYPFKGTGVQIPAIFQDLFLFFYLQHTQIIWWPYGALTAALMR
jgi:hypothetical protein